METFIVVILGIVCFGLLFMIVKFIFNFLSPWVWMIIPIAVGSFLSLVLFQTIFGAQ